MKCWVPVLLGSGLFSCAQAIAQDHLTLDWDWVVSASHSQGNESPVFMLTTPKQTQQLDVGLDVQSRWRGWTASLAAKTEALYQSEDWPSESTLTLSELFWQGEWSVFDQPLDMTAGKIRLDWGVGYGYRPLDLFLPYQRNPLGIQIEEGVGVIALSSYQEIGEWTLLATDSSWGRLSDAQLVQQNEQQGFGLRHYRLVGDSEWQGILYYDDVRRGLVGGSWVSVLNSAWAVHSSWLYQSEYWQYKAQSERPIELVKRQHAGQFLFGLNWANSAGHNVIAEYWYDGRSWDAEQWQYTQSNINALNQQGLMQMAFSYAQGYQAANLMAHNVMLHWTRDSRGTAWLGIDNLTPTLDVLWSVEDGGLIVTPAINWQAYDSGATSLECELAARFFGGEADSVFANLPESARVVFNLKGKF